MALRYFLVLIATQVWIIVFPALVDSAPEVLNWVPCTRYVIHEDYQATDLDTSDTLLRHSVKREAVHVILDLKENISNTTNVSRIRDSYFISISRFRLPCKIVVLPYTKKATETVMGANLINVATQQFIFYRREDDTTVKDVENFFKETSWKIKYRIMALIKYNRINTIYTVPKDCKSLKIIDLYAAGTVIDQSKMFVNCYGNLEGSRMRFSIATQAAWVIEIRKQEGTDKWFADRGFGKKGIDFLAGKMNMTVEMFPASANGSTGLLKDGKWVGTVGDVVNGRAEIGFSVGCIFPRYLYVDFTWPFHYEHMVFTISPNANEDHFSWRNVYYPLKWDSWIMFLCMGIVCTLAMLMLLFLDRKRMEGTSLSDVAMEMVYVILRCVVDQSGSTRQPSNTLWFRALLTCWLFFVLVVTTAYRSKLVSSLAFPREPEFPKTFPTLADSNLRIILLQTGGPLALLRASPDTSMKKLLKRLDAVNGDGTVCLEEVFMRAGKTACISWRSSATYLAHRCLDQEIRDNLYYSEGLFFASGGFILPKKSPIKEELDKYMLLFSDGGLIDRWFKEDQTYLASGKGRRDRQKDIELREEEEMKKASDDRKYKKFTLEHVEGPFCIVLLGMLGGLISFVSEVLIKKSEQRVVLVSTMNLNGMGLLP